MTKKLKIKTAGFTLIELLITVAVTALLTSILILYSSSGRQQTILFVEGTKLAQVINRAKALTLATYNQPGPAPCGYGINFDYPKKQYRLFSYADQNCYAIIEIQTDPEKKKFIESYDLNSLTSFQTSSSSPQDVLFIAPNPDVLFNPDLPTGFAEVILETKDASAGLKVIVGPAGQINIQKL